MTAARAWALLERVPDPELPVLSVVDLGIVREVAESEDGHAVVVTLTPTYSGCPATEVIARDVHAALESSYERVDVRTRLSPAWTTDWLSAAARDKLAGFGIAPPAPRSAHPVELGATIGRRPDDIDERPEACPQCGSADVEELAHFGSTPCKALWRCAACREPFDYVKRH